MTASPYTFARVSAGLVHLTNVIRLHAIKQISDKRELLTTLNQLDVAADLLRQGYVQMQEDGRTQSEEAGKSGLRQAEQVPREFIALAEQIHDFVCLATAHGKPIFLNKVGRRMLGLGEGGELLAASLREFHSEECWRRLQEEAVPAVAAPVEPIPVLPALN